MLLPLAWAFCRSASAGELQSAAAPALPNSADLASLILAILFGMAGLYHLNFFSGRRDQTEHLWFGLTAFSLAILTFLNSRWVIPLVGNLEMIRQLSAALVHVAAATIIQFLWPFLGERIGPVLRSYQVSHLALAGVIALVPRLGQTPAMAELQKYWLAPLVLAVVVLVARKAWRRSREARVIGAAILLLVVAMTQQVLAASQGLALWASESLVLLALAVFVFSGLFALCERFSRICGELDQTRVDLEGKAAELGSVRSQERSLLEAMSRDVQLPELLEAISRMIERQSEGLLCSIHLVEADNVKLRQGAAPSLPESYTQALEGSYLLEKLGAFDASSSASEIVIVSDIANDPRWCFRDLAVENGLRACWASLIYSSDGDVLGAFLLYYREPREPTPAEVALIRESRLLTGLAIERKQGKLRLAESERRFKSILEQSRELVHCLTAEGRFAYVNRQWLATLGYTAEEVSQLRFSDILRPDLAESHLDVFEQLKKGREYRQIRTILLAKDGRQIIVEGSVSPSFAENGEFSHTQSFLRDVTERYRAEEALRESEKRYRDLVENMEELVCTHDLAGRILSANQSLVRFAGCASASELIGRSIEDFLHPAVRGFFGEYSKVIESEGRSSGLMRVLVDGTKDRILEYRNSLSKSCDEPVVRAVARDVTERIQAERELSRLRRHNELILKAAGEGILGLDLEGNITSANPAAAYMLGWPTEDLLGSNLHRLAHHSRIDGEVYPRNECPICHSLQDGSEQRADSEVFWRGDGSSFHVGYTSTPIRREDGRVEGAVVTFRDITERKLVEERTRKLNEELERRVQERTSELQLSEQSLRFSENRLRQVIDSVPHLIFAKDAEGRYLLANKALADCYGMTAEEITGRLLSEIHPDADAIGRFLEQDRQVMETQEMMVIPEEVFYSPADGKEHIHQTIKMPFAVEGSESPAVLGIAVDITELKGLEEQLQQSQKMEAIGRLANGVAHDFNNMLSIILGYSGLSMASLPADDPLRNNLHQIEKAGERAASLTRQLLAFSRQQVLKPSCLELNQIVTGLEEMLVRIVGEDIHFETSLDVCLQAVKADPGQLEQVLMNLVVNARDAMPLGGRLTISTSNEMVDEALICEQHLNLQPGAYVALRVSDTGIGIPDALRSRIFEPFFTTKKEGAGTGLGLSTVYGIVRQSGGDLWVESSVGEGTTFTLLLPAAEEAAQPLRSGEPAELASQELCLGQETILLVEDDENVRSLTREILTGVGYTVLEACDGKEAFATYGLNQRKIDLLLTDVVMPGMRGTELVRRVSDLNPDLKAVLMSGYPDVYAEEGWSQEVAHFIPKPVRPDVLLKEVRRCLDS